MGRAVVRVKDFVKFIEARERHRKWREGITKKPKAAWIDPIISAYRFCNVRRNDDRVTKWIFNNILFPAAHHEHLWFALVVARLFNLEDSLGDLMRANCILPFKPEKMREVLHKRRNGGLKNFNGAYIVSTNGRAMDKVDYVIDVVLKPLWEKRAKLRPKIMVGQLANAHLALVGEQGLGSFMAAQVLADLKYAPDGHVWEDFDTFAASGPGSKRGLNRVMGFAPDTPFRESIFRDRLATLRDRVNARLKMEALTAQDIQNCLCEFDKYERARRGEGRPKQGYAMPELPWKEEA